MKQVALDRLQANLAVTKAEEKTPAPKFEKHSSANYLQSGSG